MNMLNWLINLLFRRRPPYLNHDEILELLESGAVCPYDEALVNTASLDILLGDTILVEDWVPNGTVLDFGARQQMKMREVVIDPEHGYVLRPGEFILAHTVEWFNLPDDVAALLRAKSSMGRTGLEHMDAGWVDPGFFGKLTLELVNCLKWHSIRLRPGDRIGQLIFMKGNRVRAEHSYSVTGNYNGQDSVIQIQFKE